MSSWIESMYSCSSLIGFVSSKRRLQCPPNSCAIPKLSAIDLGCPMCRYPLGSGGKRVTASVTRPSRTSAATMSRMKSLRSGVAGLSALTLLVRIDSRLGRSAHGFLHERLDLRRFLRGQLLEREGGRPHRAVVELRRLVEAERRVPRLELLGALEEADDLAGLVGVRGHAVPRSRCEGRRARRDDRVHPLGQGAICVRHLGDLRQHVALGLLLARGGLQLAGAFPHRGPLLGRESLR